MTRFLTASLLAGAVVTLALHVLFAGRLEWIDGTTALLAGTTATLAGTAGWSVVLIGLSRRPEAAMGFFAAGTAAKMLGLAIATAAVVGSGLAPLDAFVLSTLGAFLALGVLQMGLVAREAARRGVRSDRAARDRGQTETRTR